MDQSPKPITGRKMHLLTQLKIEVGAVLEEAANLHEFMYDKKIHAAVLPAWMFKKLEKEKDFESAGCKWMGNYQGISVYAADNKTKPVMAERGGKFVWPVL